MKTYLAMILIVLIVGCGAIAWILQDVTASMHEAAVAMTKASNDYRDSAQNYEGERLRIGQNLTQLEKDMIRIRTYLKKKGG